MTDSSSPIDFIQIIAYTKGDPSWTRTGPDGKPVMLGKSLRGRRTELGGHTGHWKHPFTGRKIAVDLSAWHDHDPDTTYIVYHFRRPRSRPAGR